MLNKDQACLVEVLRGDIPDWHLMSATAVDHLTSWILQDRQTIPRLRPDRRRAVTEKVQRELRDG